MTDEREGTPRETGASQPEPIDPTGEGTAPEPSDEAGDFAGPEADTDETTVARPAVPAAAAEPDAAVPGRSMRPGERRAARGKPAAAAPTPSERIVHIEARASRVFVAVTVGVFVLILLNALLLGKGGVLAPAATSTPLASVSASPAGSTSASPGVSGSPSASAGPSGSPSAAAPSTSPAGASPGASGSPAPSGSAGPGPS